MRIGIHANMEKNQVRDIIPGLCAWLESHGAALVTTDELRSAISPNLKIISVPSEKLAEACDILLALGGDGTMLSAARLAGSLEKPVLGVNLGGLGFLTEISLDRLYPCMEKILAGKYSIEKRMVIQAKIKYDAADCDFYALNDVVLWRGLNPRMLRLDVSIDGLFFNTYISDGLIISTPTGSTAYSLSSGGPIVTPSLDSIILNPICPHALTVRPVLLPPDSVISITLQSIPDARITVDGQLDRPFSSEMNMDIEKAPFSAHFIHLNERSFYSRLREKLQWGSLPRK